MNTRALLLGLGGIVVLGVTQWVILPVFDYRADNASRAERAGRRRALPLRSTGLTGNLHGVVFEIFLRGALLRRHVHALGDTELCIVGHFKLACNCRLML